MKEGALGRSGEDQRRNQLGRRRIRGKSPAVGLPQFDDVIQRRQVGINRLAIVEVDPRYEVATIGVGQPLNSARVPRRGQQNPRIEQRTPNAEVQLAASRIEDRELSGPVRVDLQPA